MSPKSVGALPHKGKRARRELIDNEGEGRGGVAWPVREVTKIPLM